METIRIAWRNLLRNPRRTAITGAAVALNTAVLITCLALMKGMQVQLVHNATRLVIGDAQLHATGYRKSRSFFDALPDPRALAARIERAGLRGAPRSYGQGLVSRGAKSAGATLWGVEPGAERAGFELAHELERGQFLTDAPARRAVLGRKLARSLQADVGAELVAVVQAADGSIGTEVFTVSGVLKTMSDEIDRGALLVHRDDFEQLFVAGGRVHELALAGGGPAEHLRAALGPLPDGVELRTWRELLPSVSDMVAVSGAVGHVFALIFSLAVGLGVMNTMLMATHDRVRELGMARALGASSRRLVRDIAAEGLALGVVASGVGAAVGLALALASQRFGVDMTAFGDASFGFSGIAWDPVWRGRVEAADVCGAVIGVWVLCALASLYPAVRAARLDPVRAMSEV